MRLALIALAALTIPSLAAQDHPKRAPYPALRWQDDQPEVRHDDAWWRLTAIDGVAVGDILAFCEKQYGADRARKRFGEDLVMVLSEMGKTLGDQVALQLVDLVTGQERTFAGVPMTEANRAAIRAGNRPARPAAFDPDAGFPTTLPFVGMRDAGEHLEVQLDGEAGWYEWVRIDDTEAAAVIAWCKRSFGEDWWKRITEDLPQVLALMQQPVGDRVALLLRDPATGKTLERTDVAMTRRNRQRVKDVGRTRPRPTDAPLTPAQWRADLDQLETLLRERFSYAELRVADVGAQVGALRDALGDDALQPAAFALALTELLAAFGDGHASVDGGPPPAPGHLPFLLADVGDRVVAFTPDRTGFVVADHPYLVALDGRSLQEWRQLAARLVPHGSPQLIARRALRGLRDLQELRTLVGAPLTTEVTAVFADDSGDRQTKTLPLAASRPLYGPWPRTDRHRTLAGGRIGYLRLQQMTGDEPFLASLDAAMQQFKATEGLVIDVRGNGGGSRDALRRLFPYFMAADRPAWVANIAAYRLQQADEDPDATDGYLANRGLYPATWPRWTAAARDAIAHALRTFRPEWKLPQGKFSAWHFCVLERTDNKAAYHYDRPVVVLLDDTCFSATDIFLGAFAGWPNVTLLGLPSAGGSGRGQRYRLTHSGLQVRLSTMASFRPDGRLYDGRGIAPDVVVRPIATDFLGTTDSVLEAAVVRLVD